jgi:hypothetical protein
MIQGTVRISKGFTKWTNESQLVVQDRNENDYDAASFHLSCEWRELYAVKFVRPD